MRIQHRSWSVRLRQDIVQKRTPTIIISEHDTVAAYGCYRIQMQEASHINSNQKTEELHTTYHILVVNNIISQPCQAILICELEGRHDERQG